MDRYEFFLNHTGDDTVPGPLSIETGQEQKVLPGLFKIELTEEAKASTTLYSTIITPNPEMHLYRKVLSYAIYKNEIFLDQADYSISENYLIAFNNKKVESKSIKTEYKGVEYTIEFGDGFVANENNISTYYIAHSLLHKLASETITYKNGTLWHYSDEKKSIRDLSLIKGERLTITTLSGNVYLAGGIVHKIVRNQTLKNILSLGLQSENVRSDLEEAAKDFTFRTTYGKPRKVTIKRVLWGEEALSASFQIGDKNVEVVDHFRQKYGIDCELDPMAEVEFNDGFRAILPSSVLAAYGLNPSEKRDQILNKDIAKNSDQGPRKSFEIISGFVNIIKDKALSLGLTISMPEEITCQCIPPPNIKIRSRKPSTELIEQQLNQRLKISQELRQNYVALPPNIKSAPVIICITQQADDARDKLAPKLLKEFIDLGIAIPPPYVLSVDRPHHSHFINAICTYIQRCGVPSAVLVVVPQETEERYRTLKQLFTCELGIVSQFALSDSVFGRDQRTVLTRLCVDIAAKLGCVPAYISPSSLPIRSTLIVGISQFNSITAASASTDSTFERYFTQTTSSKQKHEFLASFAAESSMKFRNSTGLEPTRVVIFRDGCGVKLEEARSEASVFGEVLKMPVACLVSDADEAMLTTGGARPTNAPAGSIVAFDGGFVLQSTFEADRTRMATRYSIVRCDPGVWRADQLATMAHFLTTAHPAALESLSVPAPAALAAKAAKHCGEALNGNPAHRNLSTLPYFI